MNGATSSRTQKLSFSPIESLPDEILIKICSIVVAHSARDAVKLKMVSTNFLRICELKEVLVRHDYPEPPRRTLYEEEDEYYEKFVKRLRGAGNVYVTMRCGLHRLFGGFNMVSDDDKGLRQLVRSAAAGNVIAKYMAGVVKCILGGDHRVEGLELLYSICNTSLYSTMERMENCRMYVSRIICRFHMEAWPAIHSLKELYEKEQCTCEGRGEKWFVLHCRPRFTKGFLEDITTSSICCSCLVDELVTQFLKPFGDQERRDLNVVVDP